MVKIRHRASVVCIQNEQLLLVEILDPATNISRWILPGGEIEANETPEQAAIREAREETGYQVVLNQRHVRVLDYDFYWYGFHTPCRTHFFAAEIVGDKSTDSPEELPNKWHPVDTLPELLGYHPRVLEVILDLVQNVIKGK